MSHVTHHHLGDSGTAHASHHGSHELSVSHHVSSTSHALHHEATVSLSSPHSASGVHLDKTGVAKPVAAKTAETVHISSKDVPAAKTGAPAHVAARTDKVSNHAAQNFIPALAIVSDALTKQAKAISTKAADSPVVQRVDATVKDTSKSLFASPLTAQKTDSSILFHDSKAIPPASIVRADAVNPVANIFFPSAIADRISQPLEPTDRAKPAVNELPTIKVNLQNPGDQKTTPNFIVKTDGTVEMLRNPQNPGQKEIVIQFQRNGDNVGLTEAQKQAGGDLYTRLQEQLKAQYPHSDQNALRIEDSQGLLRDSKLPPEVKRSIERQQEKADVSQGSGLPEHSSRTMQDTRRISQGGRHAHVPRSDVDEMTPPVKRIPNEADRMQAMKDTVASYVTRGEQHPYDYVAKRGEHGWGVGRYGMTYHQVGNWLSGLSDDQIAELIKEGKLSPEQAAGLKKMRDSIKHSQETGDENDLHPFLKALKNGEGTEEQIRQGVKQFLPDKVQELAASDQISKITGQLAKDALAKGETASVNPGQVALSFVLGRTVSKEEYQGNPEYKNFVQSANQAYRLQEQARVQGGPIINVENMSQVSGALNQMVGQQFWREAAGATEYGNKGCAIAVTRMLQHMGVQIGAHLDVNGTAQEMRQRGWQEVSLAQAVRSGQLYVAVNKETGSHVGLGMGSQVWENSSGQRQVVTRNIGSSTLRNSGRAFIVPVKAANGSDKLAS